MIPRLFLRTDALLHLFRSLITSPFKRDLWWHSGSPLEDAFSFLPPLYLTYCIEVPFAPHKLVAKMYTSWSQTWPPSSVQSCEKKFQKPERVVSSLFLRWGQLSFKKSFSNLNFRPRKNRSQNTCMFLIYWGGNREDMDFLAFMVSHSHTRMCIPNIYNFYSYELNMHLW